MIFPPKDSIMPVMASPTVWLLSKQATISWLVDFLHFLLFIMMNSKSKKKEYMELIKHKKALSSTLAVWGHIVSKNMKKHYGTERIKQDLPLGLILKSDKLWHRAWDILTNLIVRLQLIRLSRNIASYSLKKCRQRNSKCGNYAFDYVDSNIDNLIEIMIIIQD